MIRKSKINKNYKKDSLKNLSNIEIILDFIIILICIIFNTLIFINQRLQHKYFIITCSFTITILGIFYLKKIVFKRYINDILVKLSDMLQRFLI